MYGMSRFRFISTVRLNPLRGLHLPPINVVIFNEALVTRRVTSIPNLGDCFALRCFQRLSIRNIVTRRCRWHDSRYARGSVIPVLSSSPSIISYGSDYIFILSRALGQTVASLFYDKSRRVICLLADLPLSGSVDTGSE